MKKILLAAAFLPFICNLHGQEKRIYIAPDDHTDYMWTADEEKYRDAFLGMLDYYIMLNDSTAGNPWQYQSKWNCDGSFWVYTYEKNRSPEQFQKLVRQMKEQRITVPLNSLITLQGVAPVEATIRDMYYAGSLERRFGLDLDLVINMEDQVLPLGLASVWAGAGARYSWHGVCDCATKVSGFHNRQHEIYWYKGLDDQKILMKWYSLGQDNQDLGGYAEARNPDKSVGLCKKLMENCKYPYNISGAFGKGWDDLSTKTDEFIKAARENSDAEYQVIVSNETDFFHDFEKHYGSSLPSETVSYGSSEWGINVASLAEISANVKRSVEKLRAAEAMYTLVSLKDRKFAAGLNDKREKAWMACGLYFEHDWTADGIYISKKQRADWENKIARQLSSYVDTLYDLSLSRLGQLIGSPGKSWETFFVFNTLSWSRSDYCDYPYNGSPDIKVIDTDNSREVPFQLIMKNNVGYIRILAGEVPPLGYKVYQIRKGRTTEKHNTETEVSGPVFENAHYKIEVSPYGVIRSLVDKKDHNYEYIRPFEGAYANDPGKIHDPESISSRVDQGVLTVENSGPVSTTILASSYFPLKHTTRITLFDHNNRIEVENSINENIGAGPVSYTYCFNLDNPETWHEEAGAIIKAKPQSEGGHYADSICRVDWLALNHFVTMSDGCHGITISNSDAYLMKIGNSTVGHLDWSSPVLKMLAGGQIDAPALGISNQDGNSTINNHFALMTASDGFDAASAMRFSLEHQNPLVSGKVNGNKGSYGTRFSLFEVSDPGVLVWALKPSEEGIGEGIIIRLWNMNDRESDCTISSGYPVTGCMSTTHIETNISEIEPVNGTLKTRIGRNRIQTYRVFLEENVK